MTQRDIYWITFPGGGGRAQAGRRPAVIVQNDETSQQIPTTLVIPLTTQRDALRFPGTILIDPDGRNGISTPSVALVFQLTAIDQRYMEKRIGTLDELIFDSLLNALTEITEQK